MFFLSTHSANLTQCAAVGNKDSETIRLDN